VAKSVTIVDRVGVAPAASGKAGGFLALDWNDGSEVEQLSRKSFEMHKELARELNLDSYRTLTCNTVAVSGGALHMDTYIHTCKYILKIRHA
jgi:hypothetical protein